jgi:hypothetical protein
VKWEQILHADQLKEWESQWLLVDLIQPISLALINIKEKCQVELWEFQ